MPLRTDADAVKAILLRDYDTRNNPGLTPYLTAANLLVNRLATYAIENETILTDEELTVIEAWLAAHFYKHGPDQAFASKATEGASASFQGQTGMGLKGTKYGQTAIDLDYSGFLLSIANGSGTVTASGVWLGTPYRDQTSWSERNR